MAQFKTVNGITVTIDDEDLSLVSEYRWYAYVLDGRPNRTIKKRYVTSHIYLGCVNGKGRSRTMYLHRMLLNAEPGVTVDHINGNTLDNRRSNLRIASRSQQNMNRGVPSNNTSGFKGVSWYKRYQRWAAFIHLPDRKQRHLGYFDTAEEAARRYDAEAMIIFGEFANLNFPA